MKPRQKGLSKIIDGDQLIDCIKKPTNAVVISHEKEATKRLLAAVKYFIQNMEVPPALSTDSKQTLQFPKSGSSYFIGTAGQKAFGRGDTVDRAHLSEAAFYEDLERILGGIAEAAEYGQIDIETTPNGRDQVYDMVQKIKAGKSPYTFIFIPWFIDREYSSDNITEKEKEGLSESVQNMFSVSDHDFRADLQDDEKKLIDMAKRDHKIDLTMGQIKWRRYKIWDKGDLFFQEYPEDDVSCFLQSGRSVFSRIVTDPNKRIDLDNFAKWPEERLKEFNKKVFFAGVDGAEGTENGDRHAFAVIDIDPEIQKGNVIYQYASNEPIDVFWSRIAPVAKAFKMNLGIEKNGVGVAHVQKARQLGVPHRAWETTSATRPVMISELEEAYRKEDLIETYPDAENEARDMIYTKSNRPEHMAGKHDDKVFARAIAWQMRKLIPRITVL